MYATEKLERHPDIPADWSRCSKIQHDVFQKQGSIPRTPAETMIDAYTSRVMTEQPYKGVSHRACTVDWTRSTAI